MVHRNRISNKNEICRICGASARYSYYGAIVCHSCKMFFRRHAENETKIYKCLWNGNCEINTENRRTCSSCRLEKCFANGMSTEMIRCRRTKQINMNPNKNRMKSTSNSFKINSLHISTDQWNVLSKLVDCFDEKSGLGLVDHFIDQQNCLPMKFRYRTSAMIDFSISIVNQAQITVGNVRDFHFLPSKDRRILLQTTSTFASSLIIVLILRQSQLFNYPSFYESCQMIFGSTTLSLTKSIIEQLDPDTIFIKVLVTIITFSTVNLTKYLGRKGEHLSHMKSLLAIQDMYVDLAWRYLTTKYGEIEAVKRFSRVIQCLLMIANVRLEAENSESFKTVMKHMHRLSKHTLN